MNWKSWLTFNSNRVLLSQNDRGRSDPMMCFYHIIESAVAKKDKMNKNDINLNKYIII